MAGLISLQEVYRIRFRGPWNSAVAEHLRLSLLCLCQSLTDCAKKWLS